MAGPIEVYTMQNITQLIAAAERSVAGTFTYDGVKPAVDELRATVTQAIADDDKEANDFMVEGIAFLRDGANYSARKERFDNAASALKASALTKLGEVEALYTGPYAEHADVPEQLDDDANTWGLTSARIADLRASACELQEINGWSGKAATDYASTVQVQINALAELAGIAASLRQSCRAGALMNRALFFLFSKYVIETSKTIRSATGRSGYTFYRRTARSVGALESLLTRIKIEALTAAATGSVDKLTAELRHTASMPAILKPGQWPSDASMAEVSPIDTSQGVTVTGEDTNLRTAKSKTADSGVRR